jgi:hypothetical protein
MSFREGTADVLAQQQSHMGRNGTVGAWPPEVVMALSLRPGPTKSELREQAAEAVASYEGPITRCAPKRRKAL